MKPQNPTPDTHHETLQSVYKVLRGNVSLGQAETYASDGTVATYKQDNGNGILIRIGPSTNPLGLPNHWSGANSNTTITHNLNRIPLGYFATKKNIACDIYDGTVLATDSQITLRCTDATADTVIYIF